MVAVAAMLAVAAVPMAFAQDTGGAGGASSSDDFDSGGDSIHITGGVPGAAASPSADASAPSGADTSADSTASTPAAPAAADAAAGAASAAPVTAAAPAAPLPVASAPAAEPSAPAVASAPASESSAPLPVASAPAAEPSTPAVASAPAPEPSAPAVASAPAATPSSAEAADSAAASGPPPLGPIETHAEPSVPVLTSTSPPPAVVETPPPAGRVAVDTPPPSPAPVETTSRKPAESSGKEVASKEPTQGPFGSSFSGGGKGPIDIKSDTLSLDYNHKSVLFTGHVHALQQGGTLTSDTLRVNYGENFHDVQEMFADGNVRISQGTQYATGDHAVMVNAQHTVVLTGSPIVHDGQDQITGTKITVHLDTGQSVVAHGHAVLFPKSGKTASENGAPSTDGAAASDNATPPDDTTAP